MKLGLYTHWKENNFYRVVMLSERDGDREPLVTYVPLYGEGIPTTRTQKEFNEVIERDGYKGLRFNFIRE